MPAPVRSTYAMLKHFENSVQPDILADMEFGSQCRVYNYPVDFLDVNLRDHSH